ncbi:hypothetical protein, partial [Sphingomonas sp.]|uniref:ABC transporter permease n=1 Tax=Sphingomonas sp. TaxID=28214 RepID=UPI00344D2F4F|nr:ABC transporter permease [Sphingomonas sp.]
KSLFDQPLVVYLGFAFVAALAWLFRASTVGLNLRAAGEKPEALDAAGISVLATRSWAALSTGMLAGLGGAYLSVAATGIFTPFMTQGQGYMAIVVAMLARGRPVWVLVGSFLFGISLSLATSLQIAGINISTDLVNMLPFVAIIVALGVGGSLLSTWIRIKNGYPLQNSWGLPIHPRTDQETAERIRLLTGENAQLRAELGSVKDRLETLERIATDTPSRLARDIDALQIDKGGNA